MMSLAARQAKGIEANAEGFDAKKLLPSSSGTQEDIDHLKTAGTESNLYEFSGI